MRAPKSKSILKFAKKHNIPVINFRLKKVNPLDLIGIPTIIE